MSGMASTSVYSKYYTFYMDTGISISIAPPPIIEGMNSDNSHYISDYFDSRELELVESASSYMAIIDLWVEDEINTYKTPLTDVFSKNTSIRLSYRCNESDSDFSASGEQNVLLNLKNDLPQETIDVLQKRLCLWKTKHLSNNFIPIDITSIENINKETAFGSFTTMGGNLRTDVALNWEKYQLDSLEKWVPVVQAALTSVENKFEVKIFSLEAIAKVIDKDMTHANRVDASWGPIFYTAWFVEEDKRYAEEIKQAISYYVQEKEFSEKLIETLPLDTRQYLKIYKDTAPISATDRKKMKDEIVKVENDLQASFKPFDISVTIIIGKSASYSYDWEAVQRLHDNLALFNRLLNEANEIGIKMKNNGVSVIEFSIYTWDDMPNKKINMTVQLNAAKENTKWTLDIHFDELKQKKKEQEFYEILLGERGVGSDDFSIEIL